jgi:hypothetical protein
MSHLDPTYLRYIYDGLIKGSIHPENESELPEGLIGLYEESFEENIPMMHRQKLLQRFALFALLKKEVSISFVAEVLEESENDILEFINTYASWFNSPESGKYQLYHERLKVYLLQKLSEDEVSNLNKVIVSYLQSKLEETKPSESVIYCYEFISFHLFLLAYLKGESDLLAHFCLDNDFKSRQFEISHYYDWEEKLMSFGVEYFSIIEDSICHQLVFEKTKLQSKKKNIDIILTLIRKGQIEIIYYFFQNTQETDLLARVEVACLYIFVFFEIFEKEDWGFVKKKEIGAKLLEIFLENFKWDRNERLLSEFIDVNISFRLHCYFEQFGLNFNSIGVLSSYSKDDNFYMQMDDTLKFIDSKYTSEINLILKQRKKFNYGFKDNNVSNLIDSGIEDRFNENIGESLKQKMANLSKTQLIRDELAYSSDIIESFDELCSFIKITIKKIDINRAIKYNIIKKLKDIYIKNSNGLFSIKGLQENLEGKNTLEIIKNDLDNNKNDNKLLPEFIKDGLVADEFIKMESISRYKLLKDLNVLSDDHIELKLFLLEISGFYKKEKTNDLINLLCNLLIEFHLNMNTELIDKYIHELICLIDVSKEESEEFENVFFIQLLDFFKRNEINGHIKNTFELIKETLLEIYFDFTLYNYSFVAGCELINLFSNYSIYFPEDKIVDRILEDLNFLIVENDYDEMNVIETSEIKGIYNKSYFWDFYNTIKRISIEQVRNYLSEYIFHDIIKTRGLNNSTITFLKNNSNDFPGMHLWAKKALSEKISETELELSYLPILENNELLLERLLVNIVSKRESLKQPGNIEIIKYYGLNWVLELGNEFDRLNTII